MSRDRSPRGRTNKTKTEVEVANARRNEVEAKSSAAIGGNVVPGTTTQQPGAVIIPNID